MIDLSEIFKYDEYSPTGLVWNTDIYSGRYYSILEKSKGEVAGSTVSSSGYCQVRYNRKLYLCHRVIWELSNGEIPDGYFVDHKDGNKQNNHLDNLRLVTRSGNARNAKGRVDNTSGHNGVYLLTNKNRSGSSSQYWRATWFEDGRVFNKNFSVKVFGYDNAFNMATEHRIMQQTRLGLMGEEFSSRHGIKPN